MALASGMRGRPRRVTGTEMPDGPVVDSSALGGAGLDSGVVADASTRSAEDRLLRLKWRRRSFKLPVRVRYDGEILVVLLHGIGCSRESFDDAFASVGLHGYSMCAFDFPGHGAAAGLLSRRRLSEPKDFLQSYADVTRQVVRQVKEDGPGIRQVFIVGHSMGGAVGVIAASDCGDIDGLVNVDGNLVAEDCGIVSRKMAEQSLRAFLRTGFAELLAGLRESSGAEFKAWARWCAMANPRAVHRAARSLVSWSDSGKLLEKFNEIPSRAYMYGAADDREYIIKQIDSPRVSIAPVPGSGHFAMIDNALEFYRVLSSALSSMR
jgi:pimeloyl-ACP methyl ester carboxylesterase